MRSIVVVAAIAGSASAGALDLGFGPQGTLTAWPGDHGRGAAIAATWWFRPWIGAAFIGKEQYATVDDRFLSYFSLDVALRQPLGWLRLTGTLGLVHQHEESRAAVMDQPFQAVLGVGDGIRHRGGGRIGGSLAWPFRRHGHGDFYLALDLDGTAFLESTRGPRWMASAGLSVGFTYDWSKK
jgi:hypothetical protein